MQVVNLLECLSPEIGSTVFHIYGKFVAVVIHPPEVHSPSNEVLCKIKVTKTFPETASLVTLHSVYCCYEEDLRIV